MTGVSPPDRDKDKVLDPGKMLAHFSALTHSGTLYGLCEAGAFA